MTKNISILFEEWDMSFVTNSLPSLRSGTRTVIVLFLSLWLVSGLCLLTHNLLLKRQIKQQQFAEVEAGLQSFLTIGSGSSSYHFTLQISPPDSIDFIRITKDRDQLLITDNKNIPFTGLVDLAPHSHGIWVGLTDPDTSGDWILISRELSDGSIIQAGRNDLTTGIAIYKSAVTTSLLLFFFSALPCLSIALLLRRMQKKPLQDLSSAITESLKHNHSSFPKLRKKNDDLIKVFQLLDKTFTQNRQLIFEMQSSLDNVAHDLRTPMTRLRAVAEYALQSDRDDPETYRNGLSDCLEESERVLSMLGTMMSVAEAEAGTMRLNTEEISLKDTLDDVISLYQYVAEEEEIRLSLEMADTNILILADKTRISQVWANLIDNAIKYGRQSGKVIITVKTTGKHVAIRFYDDGMGISDSEISRIWERLYRGDRSRSKQGLGLGLNYVKAVVEAHGGKVTVSSRIREGSCFEVLLPTTPATISGKAEITDQGRMIRETDIGNGEV